MNFKQGIVFLIFLIILYSLLHFKDFSLIFVKSNKDDNYHLVRNLPDRKSAANTMAEIKDRLSKIVKYLSDKFPNDKRTKRLIERFNINSIQETRIDSNHTSFSIDKGEEIHLCIRSKKENYNIHKINTLMFVALHELAHVASKYNGHGNEFNNNFIWILKHANNIGVYNNVDYSNNVEDFCGEKINNNPLVSKMRILKK